MIQVTYSDSDGLKVKEIQKELNIQQDGFLGPHTIDCMYRSFANPNLPYHGKFYGQDVFYADPNKVEPFDPGLKPASFYKNVISGSFSWQVNGRWQPISVLIQNGNVVCPTACHATDINMPESVLWYQHDGKFGIDRIKHVNELSNLSKIKWAVGGLGIKKGNDRNYYNNVAEGFTGPFADVLRVTSHMIIGFHGGTFAALMVKSKGINDIRKLIDNLGWEYAVMLDGGSLTACNFGDIRYKTYVRQRYMIQLGG
jgi:hypothetical protein